jgi:hypothetical protein
MPPELWVPGYAGPLDDLIDRIHRRIEQFAGEVGADQAYVEIELVDGVRYTVESLSAEPGYGFVTLRPHAAEGVPDEVIVPVGSIARLELSKAVEERGRLGFSLPSG